MIIPLIFIFVVDKDARPLLQPILIVIVSVLTVVGITILVIYLTSRDKRRKMILDRINAIEDGEDNDTIPELTEDVINQPNSYERSNRRVVKNKRKLILNYKKKSLVFKGKIKDEKCPICKLELRDNQNILVCPQCKTLYHEDHLIQWIDKENCCPVCDEAYAIIDNEKEIKTKKE